MDNPKVIGNRIKTLRGKTPMKEFADKLSISFSAYQNYEYGKRIPPGPVLEKLADLCHVTTDFILKGKEFIEKHRVVETLNKLEEIAEDNDYCSLPASEFLKKYEKKLVELIAEEQPSYGLDDVAMKIMDMLKGMDENKKRETLRFIEGQKLLADREKKLREG